MHDRRLRGCPLPSPAPDRRSIEGRGGNRPGGRLPRAAALALLLGAACSKGGASVEHERDPLDFSGLGGDEEDLAAGGDLAGADLRGGAVDLRAGVVDLRTEQDLRAGAMDLRAPADLSTGRPPCLRGTGFAAFRFHYEAGSTSARLDAFGLPDNTNWQAVPAYSTSVEDLANGGGLSISGGNWILIRFSLAGLSRINGATLSMKGRSYNVSASGSFEAWSPLYGSINSPINSVSNAWPYSWTSVDYTSNVRIGDDPGLTGIRFYARGNSNSLVVNTIELCIDGS